METCKLEQAINLLAPSHNFISVILNVQVYRLSDVEVNQKLPWLFFAGDISDYTFGKCDTRPSARYLIRKMKSLERVCKQLLESKAKPVPPEQSVK